MGDVDPLGQNEPAGHGVVQLACPVKGWTNPAAQGSSVLLTQNAPAAHTRVATDALLNKTPEGYAPDAWTEHTTRRTTLFAVSLNHTTPPTPTATPRGAESDASSPMPFVSAGAPDPASVTTPPAAVTPRSAFPPISDT